MNDAPGASRLYPSWWNHQRHVLAALRRALEHMLQEHVPLAPGQTIIDLGCGDRPYQSLFDPSGCRYIGCDLTPEAEVRVVSGERVPLADASADGVVSFQVLEDVWDLDWYLGEAYRILKPGGWLLLSTHGSWPYHPHPTDFRRWTRDGLVAELDQRSFRVQRISSVVGPLAYSTQMRLLGIHHALNKLPMIGPLVLAPLTCLMNLRMAIEDAITPGPIRDANACVFLTLSRKPTPAPGAS